MPRYGYVLKVPRDFYSYYGFGFLACIRFPIIVRPEGKEIDMYSWSIAVLWTENMKTRHGGVVWGGDSFFLYFLNG